MRTKNQWPWLNSLPPVTHIVFSHSERDSANEYGVNHEEYYYKCAKGAL